MEQTDIVYGILGDELVLGPRDLIEGNARLWSALRSSRTWGDFRSALGTDGYREFIEYVYEADVDRAAAALRGIEAYIKEHGSLDEGIEDDDVIASGLFGFDLLEEVREDFPRIYGTHADQDSPEAFYSRLADDPWAPLVLAHWTRLPDYGDGDPDEPLADDAPFRPDSIPGYADGDFPPMVQSRVEDWMPEEIRYEYGQLVGGMVSGTWPRFDAADANSVMSSLEKRGFSCERNDELVASAAGRGHT